MASLRVARGDVYRLPFPYAQDPSQTTPIDKWVVVLQGGRYWEGYQSILVAVATSRQPIRPYPHMIEVQVGDGGFEVRSWIDCGDLYRLRRERFQGPEAVLKGRLGSTILEEIDDGLLVGTGIEDGSHFLMPGAR